MGSIITFYSYKGGVGRSMALANCAIILTRWNYSVLIIDWDLEAPGIENFFSDKRFFKIETPSHSIGMAHLLCQLSEGFDKKVSWKNLIIKVEMSGEEKKGFHILPSGRTDKKYLIRFVNLM